jgi:hypothetical protein
MIRPDLQQRALELIRRYPDGSDLEALADEMDQQDIFKGLDPLETAELIQLVYQTLQDSTP